MSEEGITDALLPCPFCGKHGVGPAFVCEQGRWDIWQVECGFCDISIESPIGFQGDAAKKAAIERWNTRQSSLPPVKGTIVEKVARAIDDEAARLARGGHGSELSALQADQFATAAIEAMPIQKMVEGLERARQNIQSLHQATYGFGNAELVERWCARIDSLLASVRSDAHD